ncbi:hypothetical protein CTAYLR_007554 [Chrysophaeum taylorii]|uniref:Phytanoyl-CoA dioxygenase n=1 Tax=Chrysophaeum taylorii TaxID=2483200 RepID=A0AAD7U586_9STRA|nr:hypothetical protein CTAYLR_007554 [Chrysophaeum taylorii]
MLLSLIVVALCEALSLESVLEFERRGHVCTRGLLPRSEVEACVENLWSVARADEARAKRHAEAMNVDGTTPFLQIFNPHRHDATALRLAFSPVLAATAADLLGADELRLYQSCVFWKRAGDASTNWHSDLVTSPLDSNHFVTAWLPLVDVPVSRDGGTGLLYAEGSHRDLALCVWYGDDVDASERYDLADHGRLEIGDASWHHGWTLHSAAPNPRDQRDRLAFAVSYVANGARLVDAIGLDRVNDEDAPSYDAWIHDCDPGEQIDHPLLPLVCFR